MKACTHYIWQSYSWVYTQKNNLSMWETCVHPHVQCSTGHKQHKTETTQGSINEQTEKTWCVYMTEYYSAVKKNEILTWWLYR
jgi:hypothetical protein